MKHSREVPDQPIDGARRWQTIVYLSAGHRCFVQLAIILGRDGAVYSRQARPWRPTTPSFVPLQSFVKRLWHKFEFVVFVPLPISVVAVATFLMALDATLGAAA